VLIVGPDDGDRRALHMLLDGRGISVAAVGAVDQAERWLAENTCDLVIVDAAAVVLHLAAAGDDVEALAQVARMQVRGTGYVVPGTTYPGGGVGRLIGESAAMQALRETIERIAQHRSTVLITGESGTGKELVARAIHEESARRDRRFVAINCAAIPATLLESELFGHRRGAFTDAVRDRAGLFEEADGGTLFLDEVGELPPALQVKLLRAIQESEIRRVGDTQSIHVDVRLIAATLRNLDAEIAAGRFREDLYYRLAVLPVEVPPLRDRADDVPGLVAAFTERHLQRHGHAARFSDDALALLRRQCWPGNVRELENTVERALVLTDSGDIDAAFLRSHMRAPSTAPQAVPAVSATELSIKKATIDLEIDLIRRALETTGGNRTNAARLLEISHRALLYKIKEYGLT
jgi:two-component system response regulator AtoC